MEPSDKRPVFNRATRVPLDAVVRLHFEGTVAYQNGFAANVSATGMFVKHPDPPPVGTKLVFEFTLGTMRKPVQGGGEVVWVREKYQGPGQPAGVGIQFTQLDNQSRQHIAEALFEYLEQSLGEPLEETTVIAQRSFVEADLPPEGAPASAESPAEAIRIAVPPPPAAGAAKSASPAGLAEFVSFATPSEPAEQGSQLPDLASIVRDPIPAEPRTPVAHSSIPIPAFAAAAAKSSSARTWLWLGVAAIVAGIGGYVAWERFLSGETRGAPAPPPSIALKAERPRPKPAEAAAPTTPAAIPSRVDGSTLAEAVSAPAETSAGPAPATTGTSTAPSSPAAGTPTPAAAPPPAAPAPSAPAVAETPSALAHATTPVAPAAQPSKSETAIVAPPRTEGARAKSVTDVAWSEEGDATLVTITGDGGFPTGSFVYNEIGGDAPRVLLRLKGIGTFAKRGTLPVGTASLKQIRSALHPSADGSDLHMVFDLATGKVRVAAVTNEANRLVVRLTRR